MAAIPDGFEPFKPEAPRQGDPGTPAGPGSELLPSWYQPLGPGHENAPAAAAAPAKAGLTIPEGFEPLKPEKMGYAHGLLSEAANVPIIAPIAQQITGSLHALNPTEGYSQKPTFSERRQENVAQENARMHEFEHENPIASTAANLAGTAVASAPAAATAAGATALGLGGRTIASQMGRMAASGAGINATDAALRGEDPVQAAATGAVMGSAVGGVVPLAGKAIGGIADRMAQRSPRFQAEAENAARTAMTPSGATAPRTVPAGPLVESGNLTTDAIHAAASNGFRQIDQQGVRIAPSAVQRLVADTGAELHSIGMRPYHQTTEFGILRGINDRSANATFGDLMADLQHINHLRSSIPNDSKNYAALGVLKNNIQSFMNNLKPPDVVAGNAQQAVHTLQQANRNWSVFRGTELLERALRNGLINTASSGTGTSNVTNNLIQQFKPLYKKILDGKLYYPPDVTNAIRDVAMGKMSTLRHLSRFAPTGIVSLAADMMLGHGVGATSFGLMGLGTAAKKLAERKIQTRIQRAIDLNKAHAPAQQSYGTMAPQLPSTRLPGFLVPANNP